MNKKEIALILDDIATLLELKGANPFRVRAYRNGARAILNMEEDIAKVIQEERLDEIEGIGKHLARKVTLLYKTGHLTFYDNLKKKTPAHLVELMQIPGLGPKKVKSLYDKLGVSSPKELKKAAKSGRIAKLKGFGVKTEKSILAALNAPDQYQKRYLYWDALQRAEPMLALLKKQKSVKDAAIAGSLRRKLETIGDIDFLAGSTNPKAVMDWFTKQPGVIGVIAKGQSKSTVRLFGGMQADLRVVSPKQFVFALMYFTGSKEHNIKIRNLALKKGWSLSEYGFEPVRKGVKMPSVTDEKGLYRCLGLDYIAPELRENLGEIEAAAKGGLPDLIEFEDIKGTFHNHTAASDGKNTIREMAAAAEKLGFEYLGISDHSKSSFQAHGMKEEELIKQIANIKKINDSKEFKTHIFAGLECDILKNGKLDFPGSVLAKLDYVIVSVHSAFGLDEKLQTARIIKALENPYTTILGHATGRLLLRRNPYNVDVEKIIDAAIANNKVIEINGYPDRLDLDWRYWQKAHGRGLMCCINADAHSTQQLMFYKTGVNVARKGWVEKNQVINGMGLGDMRDFLRKRRNRSN